LACWSRLLHPGRGGFAGRLNLVERLFAEITRQTIRRGVFKRVADLEAAIAPKVTSWTPNGRRLCPVTVSAGCFRAKRRSGFSIGSSAA
jgi:hypothetical protein